MNPKQLLAFMFLLFVSQLHAQAVEPPILQEKMPQVIGGMDQVYKYIYENMQYPEEGQKKGVHGSVPVEFVVDSTGEMQNIHVREGKAYGFGLDEEAIRLVSEIKEKFKWTPGLHNGHPVNVTFTLPISFVLKSPGNGITKKPEE